MGAKLSGEGSSTAGVFPLALGVAYLLVGVGLFVSLATGSSRLFTAVAIGILGLVGVSLAVMVSQEGLLTRENKLIGGFVLAAIALLFGLVGSTDLPEEAIIGVVFLVAVVIPQLLIEHSNAEAGGQ